MSFSHADRGVGIIAHSGERHQTPPERLYESPGAIASNEDGHVVERDRNLISKLSLADVDQT